jgi:hypothetical protein
MDWIRRLKHRELAEGCDKSEPEFIAFLARYLALTKAIHPPCWPRATGTPYAR